MTLQALDLEEGGGRRVLLLASLGRIKRHDLEAGPVGVPGIGLLPCPAQPQDDDVLGQVLREGVLGQDEVEQLRFPAGRIRGR